MASAPTASVVTLVIPCYNEALRLDVAAFVAALHAQPSLQLCFVDDGSTDATASILRGMQSAHPDRTTVLTLPANRGKAHAVRAGLLHVCAMSRSAADVCGFWDADLSAALDELPAMLAVFADRPSLQWVWAIRLKALGRSVTRGAWRHYLGRGFATATSLLLDVPAYDTQCGAKLFRVSPLLRDVISEPFLSRWVFDVEMLARADAISRATSPASDGVCTLVYEQPLRAWHHRGGSKARAWDFVRALLELWRIRAERARWARPTGTITAAASSSH
jgi:glycosyltransferase involved in cell wall biosynthesis